MQKLPNINEYLASYLQVCIFAEKSEGKLKGGPTPRGPSMLH